MFPINLGQLIGIIGGQLVRGNPKAPIDHAVYQSIRYLRAGRVFFLETKYGAKFHPSELKSRSSAGIITTAKYKHLIPAHHPLIIVKDVDMALWKLTKWQRDKSKALIIGITGSQGKTTTKEMLASIVKRKFYTYKSSANNNIAACTPSHMFHLNPKTQVAVLEMGMSSLGNIRKQCQYARPMIGVVTNVGEAHVGSLGNSLNNVVRAKQELIDGLNPHGILVLNADDKGSRKLSLRNFKGKLITVGIKNPATFQAKQIHFGLDGMSFTVNNTRYHIKSWGEHNVYNV